MDVNLRRRARERAIASEIANKLYRALGPAMPEVGENRDTVCRIFADAFDRHGIVDESAGGRILGYVPRVLADLNLKFAELNSRLDAAMRPPMPNATSRGQR
jgi:hypothetical protein